MSTNENMPISGQFWDWMQSYWHTNRSFPPAHPDWRKKADLVNGKVPAGQLPSYVDDVLEFNAYTDLPKPGEKGKIYITTTDNKQFRWGGSAYIEISSDENVMTLSTEQSVSGRKYFVTSNGNDILNQKFWLRSFDGSNPAAVYYKDGYGSGALGFDGDEFRLTNIGTSASAYLNTKGIKKDGSNNDYVLTGGGGHTLKNDLGTSHTHQILFSSDTGDLDANSLLKDYKLTFNQRVERGSTNMFPMIDNANAVLSIASHPGGYGGQLGFNDNGQVFFRGVSAGNYGTWSQFAFKGWVENQYLPFTGGSLSGDLSLKVLKSDVLDGSQIINAGNKNQLYFGNPTVDTVYHESGNNHIFSNKGNTSFTIDYNGNVTAKNAVNAGNDSEIGGRIFGKRAVIDTLDLDESKYYPVTIQCNSSYPSTIKVYRTLDASMGVPSYSTHGGGFWCYYEFQVYGNGWGTNPLKATCNYEDESWVNDNIKVIGYDHMGRSSNVVIYVRGGSKYWFDINNTSAPSLHTSPFSIYDETVEPTKSRIWSGGILTNAKTKDIQNAISGLNFNLNNYIRRTDYKDSIFLNDIGIINLNDLLETGFFKGNNLVNAPINSKEWFFITSEYHYMGWCSQQATSYGTGSVKEGKTFKRSLIGGTTWTDWKEVATTNQLDSYIPLTGTNNFSGAIINSNGSMSIGSSPEYNAQLYLNDSNNPIFPGQNFQVIANIDDGFNTSSYISIKQYTSLASNINGVYISTANGDDATNYSFTSNGIISQYKFPTQDGNYVQRKYVTDNFVTPAYGGANYFNQIAVDYTGYTGASYDLNTISQTGFYNIGFGTLNDAGTYSNNGGARALLHFQAENPWTAMQIQTHRYKGNLISRSKADEVWSTWVRHWGDNDFTAADVSKWNNALSKSSASEEVILEDDTLTIQPDEFSLEGSGAYDIGSRKKLVHVLFREGKELNIREPLRRQTIVVFNFSKDRINLNIDGLRPYPLSSGMQVTLYISDEREVLLYNETGFKKLQ